MEEISQPERHIAYVFEWTEYERGWGQRPDGCSLHASEDAAKAYIADFFARQKETKAPDEYDAPDSSKPTAISVSENLWHYLQIKTNARFWRGDIQITQGAILQADFKGEPAPAIKTLIEQRILETKTAPGEVSKPSLKL